MDNVSNTQLLYDVIDTLTDEEFEEFLENLGLKAGSTVDVDLESFKAKRAAKKEAESVEPKTGYSVYAQHLGSLDENGEPIDESSEEKVIVTDDIEKAKSIRKKFLDKFMPLEDGYSEEERNDFVDIIKIENGQEVGSVAAESVAPEIKKQIQEKLTAIRRKKQVQEKLENIRRRKRIQEKLEAARKKIEIAESKEAKKTALQKQIQEKLEFARKKKQIQERITKLRNTKK